MTKVAQNQNALAQGHNDNTAQGPTVQPEKKSGMSTVDKLVWGAVILGFAAIVIYQVFFCPTCYTGGGRVITY